MVVEDRTLIGLTVVSMATVSESRYRKLGLEGIDFIASRMLDLHSREDADRAIEEVASARPDAIAFCCTGSGARRGFAGDQEFTETNSRRHGIPVISTMNSVLEALLALGAKKVVIVGPSNMRSVNHESDYLKEGGIETLKATGLMIEDPHQWPKVSPSDLVEFCRNAWVPEADALLIVCMNFDGMAVIENLEAIIGKPVVTSHSATLWNTLRRLGKKISIPGYGRLLAGEVAEEAGVR